jgi:LacI family transcriptional regulator
MLDIGDFLTYNVIDYSKRLQTMFVSGVTPDRISGMAPRTRKSTGQNKITVKDVSQAAGVSTATVSRVLAGFDEVSEETRQRVLEAAKTLNYQPNRNARNLRKNTTSKIGVIISDIQNPFFGSVVRGIEKVTIKDDYTIILGNSDEDPERENKLIAMLLEEGVAGIVLVPTNADVGSYGPLFGSGTPIVVIDRQLPLSNLDMVLVNGAAGAELAVDHLVSLGHKKIGYVGGMKHLSVMHEREQGYLNALKKHNLPIIPEYLRQGNNRQDGGHDAVCELLSLEQPPTAILIANNLMTLGGLQAIHESGLEIPEQVSLVGFDDMDWATSLRPPLTVVAQPAYEMGETAASILLDHIRNLEQPHRIVVLDTRLIIRASCRDLQNHKRS